MPHISSVETTEKKKVHKKRAVMIVVTPYTHRSNPTIYLIPKEHFDEELESLLTNSKNFCDIEYNYRKPTDEQSDEDEEDRTEEQDEKREKRREENWKFFGKYEVKEEQFVPKYRITKVFTIAQEDW